jgi:nucleoid-associated protein YgaU
MEAKMVDPKFKQDYMKEQMKKRLEQQAAVQKASEAGKSLGVSMQPQAIGQAATPKVIAKHTIVDDETLTHLSLRYYGHTTEPYWRLIYEFNKSIIGPDYHNIYNGLVLEIPELPESLKDKK